MLRQLTKPNELLESYQQSAEAGQPRAVFQQLDLTKQSFKNMTLLCTEWIECDLGEAVFFECDLRGADLRASNLRCTCFIRCSMYGCELPSDSSIRCIECSNSL